MTAKKKRSGTKNSKLTQTQKPENGQQPSIGGIPDGFTLTTEKVERLIASAQYKQHPYGQCWQPFDLETFNQLVGNINRRGLDQVILLYQGLILDGWHRYLACLATKFKPKFEEFKGTDLQGAEKVHASGIRRHSQPDQLYASFLKLCDACSEFKEKYEQLRQKGEQQQKDGTPLSTGEQRVDLLGTKAAAAGVSRSTAAKVEQVKKHKPEAVAEIAAGKTTANKELKKIKKAGVNKEKGRKESLVPEQKKPNNGQKSWTEFKPGETVYNVLFNSYKASPYNIVKTKNKSITDQNIISSSGSRLPDNNLFRTLEEAKAEWKKRIEKKIAELQKELLKGPKTNRCE